MADLLDTGSETKDDVFLALINALKNWLSRLDSFKHMALHWLESCQNEKNDNAMELTESVTEDCHRYVDEIDSIFHCLIDAHDIVSDAVFVLRDANKAALADKLENDYGAIYKLTEALRGRTEDLFSLNPFECPDIDTSDEKYWRYDPKIDIIDQISPFAYLSEISSVTYLVIDLLEKIAKNTQKKTALESAAWPYEVAAKMLLHSNARLENQRSGNKRTSTSADHPQCSDSQNYVKKGNIWEFCYNGKTVYVDGTLKGLPLVAYLLTRPNEKMISALDLERAVFPSPAGKKIADLVGEIQDLENGTGSVRTSKTSQTINSRALAKADIDDLKRVLDKLAGDLDKTQNEADREKIASEILHLQNEIDRRLNNKGKPRPTAGDPFEAARLRVLRQVAVVRKRISGKDGHKELYDHLNYCLKIKTYCSYTPETPPNWKIL